jgi:hypothetical protein
MEVPASGGAVYPIYYRITGDTQPKFALDYSGTLNWGPGGTVAMDTSLARVAANVLRTSAAFQVLSPGYLWSNGGVATVGTAASTWGYWSQVSGDSNSRFYMTVDGNLNWGPGNAGTDTSLYRPGPNALNMNGQFSAAYEVYARNGDPTYQTYMGYMPIPSYGGAGAGIKLNDSTIVRYGTKFLMTDAQFWSFSTIASVQGGDGWPRVGIQNNGYIVFGPGNAGTDTNLYRRTAAEIASDGNFSLYQNGGGIRMVLLWRDYTAPNEPGLLMNNASGSGVIELSKNMVGGTYGIKFGGDTSLYRPAIGGVLKTDGAIAVGSLGASFPASPVQGQIYIFTADAANGVYWTFIYDGGYGRWRFIGGPPLSARVDALETTTSSTFGDLTTIGPSITIPFSGDFDVYVGGQALTGQNDVARMSFSIGATAAQDADGGGVSSLQAGGGQISYPTSFSVTTRKTGLAASTQLMAKYRNATNATTTQFRWRTLQVLPIQH